MSYEFDTSEGTGREAVATWLRSVRNDVAVRFMECERSLPQLGLETRAGVAPKGAFEALFGASLRYVLVGDWMGLERVVRALHGVAADRGAAAGRIVSLLRVYRDSLWEAFDRDPGPGMTPKLLASLDDRLRDAEAGCLADRLDRGGMAPLRLLQGGEVRPSDAQATRLALACTDPDAETAIPAVAQLLAVSIPFDRLALIVPDGLGDARCFESEVGLAATAIDRAVVSIRPDDLLHIIDTGMTAPWCDGSQALASTAPLGLELAGCRAGVWVPLVGRTGLLGVGRISAVPVSDQDLSDLLWAATIMAPAARAWTERLRHETPPEPPLPAVEEVLAPPELVPIEDSCEVWEPPVLLDDLDVPEAPAGTPQPVLAELDDAVAVAEAADLADAEATWEADEPERMPMFVLPQLPHLPDEPVVTGRRRHDDRGPGDHVHTGPPLVDRRSGDRRLGWFAMAAGMVLSFLALGAALATVLSAGDETQASRTPEVAPTVVVQADHELPPDPEFGFLTINTAPAGVAVRVNGSVVGLSPLNWVQVPAGEVQVTVSRKGLKPWIKTLALHDSEHRKLRIELMSDRSKPAQVAARAGGVPSQQGL